MPQGEKPWLFKVDLSDLITDLHNKVDELDGDEEALRPHIQEICKKMQVKLMELKEEVNSNKMDTPMCIVVLINRANPALNHLIDRLNGVDEIEDFDDAMEDLRCWGDTPINSMRLCFTDTRVNI